ncbi:MAG: DUF2249 domain-containing protein [Anaeromyxobacter sp.]
MTISWDEVGPATKLAAVLEAWPQLERVLVGLSPFFGALENPLLRATFGKAATLQQVALAARVPLSVLLEALASELRAPGSPVAAPERITAAAPPAWATRIPHARHDARFDVERGVHPLPSVLEELDALPPGEVYELLTPLVPAPLLGLLAKRGFEGHWVVDEARGFARTLIRRRDA